MTSITDLHTRIDRRASEILRRTSPWLLRASLALTFIWFGALKVAGTTPVAALVADTITWIPGIDPGWFVPALGAFEVLLGAALLLGRAPRLVLATLVAHLIGTFLVLIVQPAVAFQNGNPLLLTTEGEFVIKNLVLISALLMLAVQRPAGAGDLPAARSRQALRQPPERPTS
jgi:putative oxidoreductase